MDWVAILTTRKMQLLGQILRRKGYVSEEQIKEALEYQKRLPEKRPLGEILVIKGFISEDVLLSAISSQSGLPCVSPFDYQINEKVFLVLPKELALRYTVFPMDRQSDILWLAVNDPYNVNTFVQLKELTGCKIVPFLSTKSDILMAIEEFY